MITIVGDEFVGKVEAIVDGVVRYSTECGREMHSTSERELDEFVVDEQCGDSSSSQGFPTFTNMDTFGNQGSSDFVFEQTCDVYSWYVDIKDESSKISSKLVFENSHFSLDDDATYSRSDVVRVRKLCGMGVDRNGGVFES